MIHFRYSFWVILILIQFLRKLDSSLQVTCMVGPGVSHGSLDNTP